MCVDSRRFKKKLHFELKSYFPEQFQEDIMFLKYYKALIKIEIDLQLKPNDPELLAEKQEAEKYLEIETRPKIFNPKSRQNAIIEQEKSFETLKALLEENGTITKELTIFEFYNRVEFLKSKHNERAK